MTPTTYKGFTIRERERRDASPPEGMRQSWTEVQVVGARGKVLYRGGHEDEAKRWIDRLHVPPAERA